MLRNLWQVRDVANTVMVGVAVGLSIWLAIRPDERLRTIPTGAGFSIAVTRSRSGANALRLASTIESTGLPAFTRSLNSGTWRQVVVGPYVSLDEAEQVLVTDPRFGLRLNLTPDQVMIKTETRSFNSTEAKSQGRQAPGKPINSRNLDDIPRQSRTTIHYS